MELKLRRKLRISRTAAIALVVTAAALLAIGLYSRREGFARAKQLSSTAAPAFVRVETVAADSTVRDSIVQNMSIEAVKRVQMIPRVSGRLERLHVSRGDKVKVGQLVASLEHEQQDALIGSAQAQLASAKADTERAKAEMINAGTNLSRYERLVKEGFSTQQQYDAAETTYTSMRAGYNAALAKERQVAAELNRVQSSKNDYVIVSPIEGTVLNDYSLTRGAMISPSSPIVDIADLRRLKAEFRIPELKIFAVKPGMPVFLRFDALPGEEFEGSVSLVDSFVDPATRMSNVEIELDNSASGFRLRPGMFGLALIVEREYRNAIVVPDTALHTSETGFYLFVEEEGVAKRRIVSTGVKQGNRVQVTEGLSSGDKVIVFGGKNLNDGESVTVQ